MSPTTDPKDIDVTIPTEASETSPIQRLAGISSSRRGFLAGFAAVGAALVAGACGNDDGDVDAGGPTDTVDGGTPTTGGDASGDLAVATLAAGLEKLAVDTYKAAGEAKLSAPPAVVTFIGTAMSHHQAALDAWNKVLKGAGKPEVTAPNATLQPVVKAEFDKVKDFGGAAKLALLLENIAASTYLSAIPTLKSKDAIALAGSIQPIDMQHAAVLNFVLGKYPVPEVFAKTSGTDPLGQAYEAATK